jgi:hypothetical protein
MSLKEHFKMKDVAGKARLSYWFPVLKEASLPSPDTAIIITSADELNDIMGLSEGRELAASGRNFIKRLIIAMDSMGYPCFLRTDYTSARKNWKESCRVADPTAVENHVAVIVSSCLSFWLPAPVPDVWVVQELLPLVSHGACPFFGDIPICKSFRFYVTDGNVDAWHPYWSEESLNEGEAVFDEGWDYAKLSDPGDIDFLKNIASSAGKALSGKWAVDMIESEKGWYIIDMTAGKEHIE